MNTAGIIIDSWKLPIFEQCLTEAGFPPVQSPGPYPGTLLLQVDYTPNLQEILQDAALLAVAKCEVAKLEGCWETKH